MMSNTLTEKLFSLSQTQSNTDRKPTFAHTAGLFTKKVCADTAKAEISRESQPKGWLFLRAGKLKDRFAI
jgi:hypothetical protein